MQRVTSFFPEITTPSVTTTSTTTEPPFECYEMDGMTSDRYIDSNDIYLRDSSGQPVNVPVEPSPQGGLINFPRGLIYVDVYIPIDPTYLIYTITAAESQNVSSIDATIFRVNGENEIKYPSVSILM